MDGDALACWVRVADVVLASEREREDRSDRVHLEKKEIFPLTDGAAETANQDRTHLSRTFTAEISSTSKQP